MSIVNYTRGKIIMNDKNNMTDNKLKQENNNEINEQQTIKVDNDIDKKKNLFNLNKKSKIVITSIISTMIIVILAFCIFIINNPKAKVIKAIKETNKEMSYRKTFVEKATGEKDFLRVYDKGLSQEIEMNIIDSNFNGLEDIYDSGFKYTGAIDNENKKAIIDMSVKHQGQEMGKVNVYTDNKKIMMKLPLNYEPWFSFNCENIQDQYNNSIFGKQNKLSDGEITLKMFGDEKVPTYDEVRTVLLNGYLKENQNVLEEIAKNIIFKKLNESKDILINGENQKCKSYSILIPKDETSKFLKSIYNYIDNNIEARDLLKRYFSTVSIVENDNNDIESFKSLENFIAYLKNDFSVNDILLKVYIDKRGRAVGFDINTVLNTKYHTFKINSLIEYEGKDNIGNDIVMSMTLSDNGVLTNADMNLKRVDEGFNVQNTFSGKITSEGETVNIDVNTNYDAESKKINGKFKIGANEEEISLAYDGRYECNKENKYLKFDFDQINIINNINSDNEFITFDFSYGRMPLSVPIEEPKGEKVEIFKIDENKLMEIYLNIQQNSNSLKQTLSL